MGGDSGHRRLPLAHLVAAFTLVRTEAIVTQPYLVDSLPSTVVRLCLIMPIPLLAITAQRRQSCTT
ncbi:hypothetical protein [Streptomyces sp. NBC_00069]|uniref:hypothetical protein n=1 Tax=Streptomyces sp. NBC_00069 TaxID=2975639 RepID=UPI00386493CE